MRLSEKYKSITDGHDVDSKPLAGWMRRALAVLIGRAP
jgi:hypothetical protein